MLSILPQGPIRSVLFMFNVNYQGLLKLSTISKLINTLAGVILVLIVHSPHGQIPGLSTFPSSRLMTLLIVVGDIQLNPDTRSYAHKDILVWYLQQFS